MVYFIDWRKVQKPFLFKPSVRIETSEDKMFNLGEMEDKLREFMKNFNEISSLIVELEEWAILN